MNSDMDVRTFLDIEGVFDNMAFQEVFLIQYQQLYNVNDKFEIRNSGKTQK